MAYPTANLNLRAGPGARRGSAFKPMALTGAMGVGAMSRMPQPEVLGHMLADQIECAAKYNTWWYFDEWAKGRDPACCAGCAGLRYVSKWESQIDHIPEIIKKGRCACGPAVAMSLGHERAVALRDAGYTNVVDAMADGAYDETCEQWYCVMRPQGKQLWHAVMQTPDGIEDVTEEMKR